MARIDGAVPVGNHCREKERTLSVDNNEALFRLLKAINEDDRDSADDAVCHLRVGIVSMKELPVIGYEGSRNEILELGGEERHLSNDHYFGFRYHERIEE